MGGYGVPFELAQYEQLAAAMSAARELIIVSR